MFAKKNTRKPIHYFIFLLLTYCIFPITVLAIMTTYSRWFGDEVVYNTRYDWQERMPLRSVSDPSNKFKEIWSISPVYAGSSYDPRGSNIYLSTQDEALLVLASFDNKHLEGLNRLNLLTGKTEWQIPPENFKIDDRASTLVSNSQFVYVGFDGLGKIWEDMLLGASSVVAINIDSGAREWSRVIGGARSIWSVNATDKWVSVIGDTSSHNYLLNATTGEVMQKEADITESGEINASPLAIDDNTLFEINACISLQATDTAKKNVIWETKLDRCVAHPAILTNELLLVIQGGVPGIVTAFDKATGEIRWQYNSVVSNVAVGNDSTAYFLTTQAELIAVDTRTGVIIATLEFVNDDNPNQYDNTLGSPLDYGRRPYSVAASKGYSDCLFR